MKSASVKKNPKNKETQRTPKPNNPPPQKNPNKTQKGKEKDNMEFLVYLSVYVPHRGVLLTAKMKIR